MKLSSIKRLVVEDFKDPAMAAKKLAGLLNPFIEGVSQILNGGIVVSDNMKSAFYEVDLKAGVSSFGYRWDKNQAPNAVLPARVIEVGSLTAPAIGIAWAFDNGTISVKLTGLDPAKEYQIKVWGIV